MYLPDAERMAKRELYELEANIELIKRKDSLADEIRARGSRAQQKHEDRGGKVTGRYINSVPGWLLEIEDIDQAISVLVNSTLVPKSMLDYFKECKPVHYEFYKLKYRNQARPSELKRRFGTRTNELNRELIFNLINWHNWEIDKDGGKAYQQWREGEWE